MNTPVDPTDPIVRLKQIDDLMLRQIDKVVLAFIGDNEVHLALIQDHILSEHPRFYGELSYSLFRLYKEGILELRKVNTKTVLWFRRVKQ